MLRSKDFEERSLDICNSLLIIEAYTWEFKINDQFGLEVLVWVRFPSLLMPL